jgi:hypothetical protein
VIPVPAHVAGVPLEEGLALVPAVLASVLAGRAWLMGIVTWRRRR